MIASVVLMPTVNVDGTSMRMFCCDSAFLSGMPMVIGVRLRKACCWITGQTMAPPPCRHLADWPRPTAP
jgi:hypothetical protein